MSDSKSVDAELDEFAGGSRRAAALGYVWPGGTFQLLRAHDEEFGQSLVILKITCDMVCSYARDRAIAGFNFHLSPV
jgi:hypothetical protein